MIVDFSSEEGDSIGLALAVFKKGIRAGLTFKSINDGDILRRGDYREAFVYDRQTGSLYYNENGKRARWGNTGGLLAVLAGAPDLSQSDLFAL